VPSTKNALHRGSCSVLHGNPFPALSQPSDKQVLSENNYGQENTRKSCCWSPYSEHILDNVGACALEAEKGRPAPDLASYNAELINDVSKRSRVPSVGQLGRRNRCGRCLLCCFQGVTLRISPPTNSASWSLIYPFQGIRPEFWRILRDERLAVYT
jgi:hypothetical protein